MSTTSWLEINLSRLDANLACLRAVTADPALLAAATPELVGIAQLPPRRSATAPPAPATARPARTLVCGVVKADAYGLGALTISQRLANRGIDMLAVFSPAQAEQLATLSLQCPVLILMRMAELGRGDPLYRHATTGRLHLSIHDRPQLQALEHSGRMLGVRLPIHLYIDTGMSRAGLSLEELPVVLAELPAMRHVRLTGIYTHLAKSESDAAFTTKQMARLDQVLETHRTLLPPAGELLIHVANTCGALRDRRLHRDMIRVGLGLYGYGPEQIKDGATLLTPGQRLLPTVRWLSQIVHVQRYPKKTPVGYCSSIRLERDSILGLVPVGYADGYPLALSNVSSVGVLEGNSAGAGAATGMASVSNPTAAGNPRAARVLGRISMDQIMVDLTDLPGAGMGTLVELVSDDPTSAWGLPRLAELAGTHCYEMLCRLSPRVPRRYVMAGGAM